MRPMRPAEFDHTHGCAANFGNRRVEDEAADAAAAEAVEEEIEAAQSPMAQKTVGRMESE